MILKRIYSLKWMAMLSLLFTCLPLTAQIPTNPAEVHPVLIGATVPDINLRTISGEQVNLLELVKEKPTVLIFYRGNWCMYCNRQMGQLQTVKKQLDKLGYQLIAISPDKPENLQKSVTKHDLDYTLLSDTKMEAAKALGIAFKMSDDMLKKYAEYGINLDQASGESHHLLPVPSAFVIKTDGVIDFEYVNPDYKVRVDPDMLLLAAQKALEQN